MAENRREKGRRYYFTRGQLALLGVAFILSAAVVFALGMLVGKDIEARKLVRPEEPLVKIPVRPAPKSAADAESAKSKDDLTFYNTLTKTPAAKSADAKSEPKVGEIASKPAANARPEQKAETESGDGKSGAALWTVQVNSFPDARSANELLGRLKDKGHNAFVTEADVKGKVWYRVRVGRFGSREEALRTEAALKQNEGYGKAFATKK